MEFLIKMNNQLVFGKISLEILSELLNNRGYERISGIVQPAELGVDVAVLDLQMIKDEINSFYNTNSTPYLVYKADPITFPTPNPGRYLIIINHNDLSTSGAIPFGVTVSIIVPQGTTKNELLDLQKQLSETCMERRITILGGHTEVSDACSKPILSASMLGFVPPEYYIPRLPQTGDAIICSGWVGAEGTSIILSESSNKFKKKLGKNLVLSGMNLGENIDISSRVHSCNRKWHKAIHMVHDATEGGILGALFECLVNKRLGCDIELSEIPLAPVTKVLGEVLEFNPYELISSGAFLLFCDQKYASEIVEELSKEDTPATIIGYARKELDMIRVDKINISSPSSDQIIVALDNLKNFT